MKLRLPSIAFLALLVPVAGIAVLEACGGDDNKGDAGPDATTDAADAAKDVAPDALDASCANDVDLTSYLPSADASFDVDAGNINLAQCTGCLKTSCGSNINSCNQDCDCRQTIIDAVTCVTQGGSPQTCFGAAILSGDQTTQDLFGCALGSCGSICIPSADGGKDSGVTDAQTDGG